MKTPVTFCSTNFENQLQKWKLVSLSISSSQVLITEATINISSEKCCSENAGKTVVKEFFFKRKLKTEIDLFLKQFKFNTG